VIAAILLHAATATGVVRKRMPDRWSGDLQSSRTALRLSACSAAIPQEASPVSQNRISSIASLCCSASDGVDARLEFSSVAAIRRLIQI